MHFCSKCSTNGRWVCTHTEATHDDSAYSGPSLTSRRSPTHDPYDSYHHRSRSPARDPHRSHRRHHHPYDRPVSFQIPRYAWHFVLSFLTSTACDLATPVASYPCSKVISPRLNKHVYGGCRVTPDASIVYCRSLFRR